MHRVLISKTGSVRGGRSLTRQRPLLKCLHVTNKSQDVMNAPKRRSAASKVQAAKHQLIAGLIETRSKILDTVLSLPQAKQDRIFLGVWSTKDLLAHLAGWDITNLKAARAIRAGKLPAFYAYRDPDWKTYNARLVSKYRRDKLADLLSLVRDTHQALIAFLSALPAEELERDRGVRFRGYKVTIARLLEAELKDEKIHQTQVEGLNAGNQSPVLETGR